MKKDRKNLILLNLNRSLIAWIIYSQSSGLARGYDPTINLMIVCRLQNRPPHLLYRVPKV